MKTPDSLQPLLNDVRNLRSTFRSARRWNRVNFKAIPAIFGNAMPKSGSHLLLQILHGIYAVAPFRYVAPDPIRMITAEGRQRSAGELRRDLRKIHSGAITWGYLRSCPEYISWFAEHANIIQYFIYRDPRDSIVSNAFYAVDIHQGHAQHEYFSSISMEERIKVSIMGRDEAGLLYLPTIREHYERYIGWLDCDFVLSIRFEDLIQNRGESLTLILNHLERNGVTIPTARDKALDVIREAIQPRNSPTFRKGQAGGWRDHFTEANKQQFKTVAGDLLIRLGYEENNDW